MTPAVGSDSRAGYYADWNGNVTGLYSDLPGDLDAVLDNTRLAKHPDARYLTDGVDETPGESTARVGPHDGQDGIDLQAAAENDGKGLQERKQLEERLFGLDLTCSCGTCGRAAVACICGMFSELAPKLKASPPAAAAVNA
jgi:hypothetical protein